MNNFTSCKLIQIFTIIIIKNIADFSMKIHPSSLIPVHPLKVVGYNIRSQLMRKMKMMIVEEILSVKEQLNKISFFVDFFILTQIISPFL